MKKSLALIILAGAAVFTLTGCADTQNEDGSYVPAAGRTPDSVGEFTYTTEDGREVFCLYAVDISSGTGGPSCDWANAVQK